MSTTVRSVDDGDVWVGKAGGVSSASAVVAQKRCENSFRSLVPDVYALLNLDKARPVRYAVSPLTGQNTAGLPQVGGQDLSSAVSRARRAQKRWARTTARQRSRWLLRLHDLVWKNSRELLDIIQWETGKSRYHAFDEVQDCAINCRYYARVLPRVLADEKRRGALPLLTQTRVMYSPKGLVGVISPWNYPLSMGITDALAAIAAGNAVVAKPDSSTPLSMMAAKSLMIKAGLDPDVFTIVPGRGEDIGTPLINSVDYMMFTGSTRTGRLIGSQCGEKLIGMSAELGGKNPMIVLHDANVDAAVSGAIRAAFANAGQLCVSVERIYVHDSIYQAFKGKFLRRVQRMRVDASLDWDVDMGVLISPQHLDAVDAQVKDAVAKGAVLLTGASSLPEVSPTAYAPTILEGVKPNMTIFDHETFGPVASLYPFHTDAQAVAAANNTSYGLNASVWGVPRHARLVARKIRAGTVNVNEGYASAWGSIDAPMGGCKDSGIGRRHGIEGIRKYMEAKTIASQSRIMPIAPVCGLSQKQYASVLRVALQVMRWLHW